MKKYKHFKKGTIYGTIEPKAGETIVATHHETQEPITLVSEAGETFTSLKGEPFIAYVNVHEDSDTTWAREYDDFHGYKVHEDGTEEKRFVLQEEKYVRPKADIQVPSNYKQIVEDTLKEYKKWLKENNRLQELADNADTEEEQKEALQRNTDHFKHYFAGVISKDEHDRLSVSQIKNIWERFMKSEYRSFLDAHLNLTLEQIVKIGIDKFVYVMGWKRPSDVPSWHNNRVRVGACCHCDNQFIPMMLQHNHGLCVNCRPSYSIKAVRNFAIHQLNTSERYHEASHDLLMDFYIIFYMDKNFRKLFLKDSESARQMEEMNEEVPEWALPKQAVPEGDVIESEV